MYSFYAISSYAVYTVFFWIFYYILIFQCLNWKLNLVFVIISDTLQRSYHWLYDVCILQLASFILQTSPQQWPNAVQDLVSMFHQPDSPNVQVLCTVAIGSSPPLAYCTIFITVSSEGVDLHICICICTSHCLCHVRIGCMPPPLHGISRPLTQFPTWFHLFAVVWLWVTWPLLCSNCGRDFLTLLRSDVE